MKITITTLLLMFLSDGAIARVESPFLTKPVTVTVRSGKLQLRGLLWQADGRGRRPAILFCHGSGPTDPSRAEIVGPVFARHGYVFLFLFRRGDGLSASEAPFMGELLKQENVSKGEDAAKRMQVRLLETEELDDALAGVNFLQSLPSVNRDRVGVVGHSFGGSLALLLAEHDKSVKAVVDFAGGAASWQRSPYLRERLLSAVTGVTAPVFFIHTENDFSTTPGQVLDTAMARSGKIHRLRVFARCGHTPDDGHNFVYLGVTSWENAVFAFLDKYMSVIKREDAN